MDIAGSVMTGRGSTRTYEMGQQRKERIYLKHRAEWRRWESEGSIDADDDNELFADWEGDWEVMDVLITRWDSSVRKRLGAHEPKKVR